MPDIKVTAEGDKVRLTIAGMGTALLLTVVEAAKLEDDLRKARVSGPTEEHLRRVGAL